MAVLSSCSVNLHHGTSVKFFTHNDLRITGNPVLPVVGEVVVPPLGKGVAVGNTDVTGTVEAGCDVVACLG